MVSATIQPARAILLGAYRLIDSPCGPFALLRGEDGSLSTRWIWDREEASLKGWKRDDRMMSDLARRIAAYFKGRVVDFSDVETPTGSEFFVRCWNACRSIPRGQVRSYGELAKLARGGAGAARAAGQSMRRNPLPVIVPCHRVIGSSGRLHGFGGCVDPRGQELSTKRTLLALEGAIE